MADIHIGKISQSETGRGKAQLVYHIPVGTPKTGIVPTSQSSEITKDIVVEKSQTQAEVAAAIKADWQNVKADYNSRYNFEHKFYGVTLSAST